MSVNFDSVANYADLYDGLYEQLLAKLNAGFHNEPPLDALELPPLIQLRKVFKHMFGKLVKDQLTEGREVQIEDFTDLCRSIQALRTVLAENVNDVAAGLQLMEQFPWVALLINAWRNWQIEVNGVAPTDQIIYTLLMGIQGETRGLLEETCVKCGRWQVILECKQIADLLETTHAKYGNCARSARKDFAEKKGLEPIDYVDANGKLDVVWPKLKTMKQMLVDGVKKIDKHGNAIKWEQ